MIQLPVISAITTLGGSVLGIIDKFVLDKDLKQKLAIRQLELMYGLIEKIINTTTIPWVDALVKLLMALVVLARPIGSFIISLWGLGMIGEIGEASETVQNVAISAFPAWGAAREVHKKREEETKRMEAKIASKTNTFMDEYH